MDSSYLTDSIREEITCTFKRNTGYQHTPYHRHNGYEIFIFLNGDVTFIKEGKRFTPKPGDIILINPSDSHCVFSNDDGSSWYERIVLNVKHSAAERLSSPNFDLSACFYGAKDSYIRLSRDDFDRIKELALKLSAALNNGVAYSDIEAEAYLSLILVLINKHSGASAEKSALPQSVCDVMKYIGEHLKDNLSLSELSEVFNYNSAYISSLFKKYIGITLKEYIQSLRIEEAKRLLSNNASVLEACYGSGFNDYSNFIRAFTKAVGTPPGRYSRQKRS